MIMSLKRLMRLHLYENENESYLRSLPLLVKEKNDRKRSTIKPEKEENHRTNKLAGLPLLDSIFEGCFRLSNHMIDFSYSNIYFNIRLQQQQQIH